MARNTDALEKALEQQAKSLEPAQMEFVMAQFEHYKWNESRIKALEHDLDNGDDMRDLDSDGKLFRQRHQLVAEQGVLFSHIMRWIKNTAASESEFDAFLKG